MTKVLFGAPKKKTEAPAKKKKKAVAAIEPKAKKAKKIEVEPNAEYIVLGKTTAIQIVETDKGEVQIQKFYCTASDPEWKRAKGGFNLPKDDAVLKKVRKGLKRFME